MLPTKLFGYSLAFVDSHTAIATVLTELAAVPLAELNLGNAKTFDLPANTAVLVELASVPLFALLISLAQLAYCPSSGSSKFWCSQ